MKLDIEDDWDVQPLILEFDIPYPKKCYFKWQHDWWGFVIDLDNTGKEKPYKYQCIRCGKIKYPKRKKSVKNE